MKLQVNLSILLTWYKLTYFEPGNSKSDKQVEWFDSIGHAAFQKRYIVFFTILGLKNACFGRRRCQIENFGNSKKLLEIVKKHRLHPNLGQLNKNCGR